MPELQKQQLQKQLKKFQEVISYEFQDIKLLEEALTHPSLNSTKENKYNYERLEFLGDSVLNLVISEMLFAKFSDDQEGQLAKRRSNLVCGDAIARVANRINIGEYLIMSASEDNMGGRLNKTNLENSMEAVIGAIYLDGGLEESAKFIRHYWKEKVARQKVPKENPKTALQEWAQARGKGVPEYIVKSSEGPSHAPIFEVEVKIPGTKPTKGTGRTKKEAEKLAAEKMLEAVGSKLD